MTVRSVADVARVIAHVRRAGASAGMAPSRLVQLATAVSEIATNAVKYANGGTVDLRALPTARHPERSVPPGPSLEVTVTDEGPGMDDVPTALLDSFSTGNSLGLGLSGARRLVDVMHIDSEPGRGTRIVMRKWA